MFKCAACGRDTERRSANQKYCQGCAYFIHVKQTIDAQRLARQKKEADAARIKKEASKAEERRKKAERLVTLTLEGKSLRRIAAEAKAFGLSYGQYSAAISSGGIRQLLRHRGITNPEAVLRGIKIK